MCLLGGGLMAKPNPKELFNLGMLSYDKQDFTQAKKYFEKACELNNSGGCDSLGMLYENDQGVEKNLIKAAYFYSKACDLNNGLGVWCFRKSISKWGRGETGLKKSRSILL
ncbi:hypothetical protein HPKB_0343 [Helicobacter pylori 52]|nr:hypothetical protein HPKB_0343 [Helicobacter pylori 52]